MPSDKAIANGLLQKYGEGNRREVDKLLQKASASARADERNQIRIRFAIERASLREALVNKSVEDRKERARLIRSIRTIDALMKDVI